MSITATGNSSSSRTGNSSGTERPRSNAREHAGNGVRVTVGDFDDGPGIPDDEREPVLEPGYSTAENGTGFGLSIVQRIAEAHGWTTRVTDSEAGGARFEFTGVDTAD